MIWPGQSKLASYDLYVARPPYLSVRDHRCIGKAEKRNKSVEKKRLLALKRHRTEAERHRRAVEGTTYAPGLLVEYDQ